MRLGSETQFRPHHRRAPWRTSDRRSHLYLLALFALALLHSFIASADGVFVFKWNKAIDINEPTQKAIIIHDKGREDLLLQVKYEGPLEEFGWLIPVPSLPKVEKGSMDPFYELSQLTQKSFGTSQGMIRTMSASVDSSSFEEPVKVIEIKTVGAYEVAILSAQDSKSLERWLQTHDYSIPEGKADIIDEYIRKGWFFVAAKIDLSKGVGFKAVSSTNPKDKDASTKAHSTLKKQLATGELHPLLISFDTPKCIFPLKISAINGKPSEVSLYVLSKEPLLQRFVFDKACEKLKKDRARWEAQKSELSLMQMRSRQNMRSIQLAMMLHARDTTNRSADLLGINRRPRDWSTNDLAAIANETTPVLPESNLSDIYYASQREFLQRMRLQSDKLPKSVKVLPRLNNKEWELTKLVYTFAPEEMHDLDFEPAIPALTRILPSAAAGGAAARAMIEIGRDALLPVIAACKSTNETERLNAISALENQPKLVPRELLVALLKDESLKVKFHAIRCAAYSDEKQPFTELMLELLRDENPEISREATGWLGNHADEDRSSLYFTLLNDSHPHVRIHALQMLLMPIRPPSNEITQAALRALKDPDEHVQSSALVGLLKCRQQIPKEDLFRCLNNANGDTAIFAASLLRRGGQIRSPGQPKAERPALPSSEALPLLTNKFSVVRMTGLLVMQDNADAQAIELTLPLLRETNSVIRSCAFITLQRISGQKISEDDPAKWDEWWSTNKTSFQARGKE